MNPTITFLFAFASFMMALIEYRVSKSEGSDGFERVGAIMFTFFGIVFLVLGLNGVN